MNTESLSTRGLAAGYNGKTVVDGVELAVRAGEIAVLIGPNGAGKSTILKTLARQLAPLSGAVYLDGRTLAEMAENELAKTLSIVTTERVRGELMTCADVVAMGRYPYTGRLGILSENDRRAVTQAMELVDVTALRETPFESLSDGQRQRVMLARAICQEPKVLLLDEPTTFLDVRYQLDFLSALRRLVRERGVSVIASLHELELARRVADTVICIREGKVDRVGAPEEVLTDAYIETLYDMERGSLGAFFGRGGAMEVDAADHTFFQNRACKSFPCHKGVPEAEFNCLFCYCPLYALGDRCGGGFHYTEKGSKSCVDCTFPHVRANYDQVLARYPELAALAGKAPRFDHTVRSGTKKLRCGYTTGTCAALAAAGAARYLLTGEAPRSARLVTPKGWAVETPLCDCALDGGAARCAVRKDAGDDPDVTDGCLVTATVRKTARGVTVDGGEGVGRVTKPGLDQPVGAAAINTVPRRMIAEAAEAVCAELGYGGGLEIVISVPNGAEIAQKTFNPMLGVEGGVSILGTSGVVEPMSEQALIDTIGVQIRQAAADGAKRLILTPGNYGAEFLRGCGWDRWNVPVVKCSNFIGDALDAAASEGFEEVLLVGHVGKLVKLAGGIMNTHSRAADCRTELFAAHAALCGADAALCRALYDAATADACLALLDEAELRGAVLQSLLAAVQRHLDRRAGGAFRAGAVIFSNEYGALGQTETAAQLLSVWKGA